MEHAESLTFEGTKTYAEEISPATHFLVSPSPLPGLRPEVLEQGRPGAASRSAQEKESSAHADRCHEPTLSSSGTGIQPELDNYLKSILGLRPSWRVSCGVSDCKLPMPHSHFQEPKS